MVMKIIVALGKDCKVLDWDIVSDRSEEVYKAKYKTMWYTAFDVEDLWEEHDYLEDDMEVLWMIIKLASSYGMSVKDFMSFLDKDVKVWDSTDVIWDKLCDKIHEVAGRED